MTEHVQLVSCRSVTNDNLVSTVLYYNTFPLWITVSYHYILSMAMSFCQESGI